VPHKPPDQIKHLYSHPHWVRRVRPQVLLNAGHRCAHCDVDLRDLPACDVHVHHVIPLEHAPELAFDIFNLEAVCTHCHNKAHGRGVWGCDVNGNPLDPSHPWFEQVEL
jgi:5-methylcytosine-specific restriction enzyme A